MQISPPLGGQAVKKLMAAYKAIIEGREREVGGWTQVGTLSLADGEEIRLIPLEQANLTGKIWRIARLKKEKEDWLLDGEKIDVARKNAFDRWMDGVLSEQSKEAEVQLFETLNCLAATLKNDFSAGRTVWESVSLSSAWRKQLARVVAVAWSEDRMAGGDNRISIRYYEPIFLTGCDWVAAEVTAPAMLEASKPMEVNETILWQFQQDIQDDLDIHLKSAPSASQVFVFYCRDRMKLAQIHRKYGWPVRTLKARKAMLKTFLKQRQVTLEMFFVDRSVFNAAERQLRDYRARHISPYAAGGMEGEPDSE